MRHKRRPLFSGGFVLFVLFFITFLIQSLSDIMWESPAIELVTTMGVQNIVFPSWWVNVPPLITGTEVFG